MTAYLEAGTEIAGFRVEALLGRGGMASVYLARDLQLGRQVALKVLSPELAASEQFQQRFHRESRLLASLDHPNIVPVYQAGAVGELLYIAMRYVPGSDLDALLDLEGRLPPPTAQRVLTQVSDALAAAHEAGLVHRDVKPGNVLVSADFTTQPNGRAYLTDFGLIKQVSSMSNLTSIGNIMGTLQYLSPEQISGAAVDARADIYALGGLAFRCLTGKPPYGHYDQAALLWAHLSEAAPAASANAPGLSEAVDDVIWTAMAKQPEERYASAAEFAAALAQALTPAPAPPPRPPDLTPRPAGRDGAPDPRPSADTIAGPAINGPRAEAQPEPSLHVIPADGPRRGARPLVLLGALALVALLVAGAVLLTHRGADGPELTRRYTANELVPFNVNVPPTWERAGSGTRNVFAPRATALRTLFTSGGSPAGWSAAWPELQRDPSAATALYTFFSLRDYDPATQTNEVLVPLLPARATFAPDSSRSTLGETSAYTREGDLVNPVDPGQRLHFLCYVVKRSTGPTRAVQLLFLAPQDTFDGNRALFGRIAQTVVFP